MVSTRYFCRFKSNLNIFVVWSTFSLTMVNHTYLCEGEVAKWLFKETQVSSAWKECTMTTKNAMLFEPMSKYHLKVNKKDLNAWKFTQTIHIFQYEMNSSETQAQKYIANLLLHMQSKLDNQNSELSEYSQKHGILWACNFGWKWCRLEIHPMIHPQKS